MLALRDIVDPLIGIALEDRRTFARCEHYVVQAGLLIVDSLVCRAGAKCARDRAGCQHIKVARDGVDGDYGACMVVVDLPEDVFTPRSVVAKHKQLCQRI